MLFHLDLSIIRNWLIYEEKSTTLRKDRLKLGDLKGALLDVDFALRATDGNAKTFFRQGQVDNLALTFGI